MDLFTYDLWIRFHILVVRPDRFFYDFKVGNDFSLKGSKSVIHILQR